MPKGMLALNSKKGSKVIKIKINNCECSEAIKIIFCFPDKLLNLLLLISRLSSIFPLLLLFSFKAYKLFKGIFLFFPGFIYLFRDFDKFLIALPILKNALDFFMIFCGFFLILLYFFACLINIFYQA